MAKGRKNTQQPAPITPVTGADGLARPPWAAHNDMLQTYYDTEWGVPVYDEAALYERLVLEGFQAGLSWAVVLRKREDFRRAFAGFDPETVARFGDAELELLLADASLIRNHRKLQSAITNAQATLALRERGGLARLLWSFAPDSTPAPKTTEDVPSQSPESEAMSKELKSLGFKFVGPTICYALMEAVGMVDTHLVGSHRRGCSGHFDTDGNRVVVPPVP